MMSRENGRELENEIDQIRQSIQDILITPIGTRLMRREYGSLLTQLIDSPFNEITKMQLYAACATALIRWENRIILESISMEYVQHGKFVLDLVLTVLNRNQKESLSIPLNFGSLS